MSKFRNGTVDGPAYILIPFFTLLHILVPHGDGQGARNEAVGSAAIGFLLLAIAIVGYEVLPRIKSGRREQNHGDEK